MDLGHTAMLGEPQEAFCIVIKREQEDDDTLENFQQGRFAKDSKTYVCLRSTNHAKPEYMVTK